MRVPPGFTLLILWEKEESEEELEASEVEAFLQSPKAVLSFLLPASPGSS